MRTAWFLIVSVVFFVLFLFLFFFKGPVLAQSQTANQTPQAANPYVAPNTNPDVPKNLHTYSQSVMLEVASSLSCLLGGVDPTDPNTKCLGVDQKTGKIGYVENGGGVTGVFSYMIASMYVNPIRVSDYAGYLAGNFGFEKKAYAEQKECNRALGLGYCGIFPLINIWTTMRNMIYLLFVVIFMAIGLGIMLRVHIDPRTVMAVENQIPKMIIAIVLATFSFAIAGFLVEIMYIVIFLVFSVFNSIPAFSQTAAAGGGLTSLTPEILQKSSAFGIASNLAGSQNPAGLFAFIHTLTSNMVEIFGNIFQINQDPWRIVNPFAAVGNLIGSFEGRGTESPISWIIDYFSLVTAIGTAAAIANNASGGAGPISADAAFIVFPLAFEGIFATLQAALRVWIPYMVIYLVLLIAVLWALFRLWFSLIQAYIFFLLNVIAAPFWMLMGLLPGSKLSFSGWFREMAADLSAFVVAIVMFWLAKLFIDAFGCVPSDLTGVCDTGVTNFFFPPLIGANPSANVVGSIIAIGTLLSVPDAVKLARAAFKPPEIDLKAAAAALGKGTGAPGRVIGGGLSTAFAPHYRKGAGGQPELYYPGGIWGRLARGFGLSH